MMGSYHQAAEFFEIIFNKDKFESLPKEHQAILEYGAEAASTANYALAMDRHSRDLETLITKDGVNIYRTPRSALEAQLKAWDKVLDQLMKDPFFKRVVESQKAWSRRVAHYDLMNTAETRYPDLILMDIQLPGIDGYEATRRIKANPALREIPIIVVTSYALSGDDVKAFEAGCDAYMSKPFSPRKLLEKIREFLPEDGAS